MPYHHRTMQSATELKDTLGWFDGDKDEAVILLIEIVMCLCDKIEALEKKVASDERNKSSG